MCQEGFDGFEIKVQLGWIFFFFPLWVILRMLILVKLTQLFAGFKCEAK